MPTAVPERPAELPGERPVPGTEAAVTEAPAQSRTARMPRGIGWAAGWIGGLAACQAALMVGIGLLITGPARHVWPMTVEDGVDRGFERIRTGSLTTLSWLGSEAGDTLTVISVTLLSCVGLLLLPRLPMWRQASFLALAVALQSLVFLVITIAVERQRPHVHRLDGSLPTSSYTSGHTGASTAIYGGLAILVLTRMRGPWRKVVAGLLLLLPFVVGTARLYRGMHHPTDVLGGMVNGALSLLIVGRALLTSGPVTAPPAEGTDGVASRPEPVTGRVAMVVNPASVDEKGRHELRRVLEQHGHTDPLVIETTPEDPGHGQALRAVREGAALVVVCGGDGTIRAAADALAGGDVPLAIVPCGTGNLLARNLGLPLDPAVALDAALAGAGRRIDLGRIEGDGLAATHFAVMSGAGLDAAMMRYADDSGRAKSVLGWAAYVVAGARALRAPRMRLSVRLDGGAPMRRTARMVLVGNIGTLQGGLRLLPAARPDDGVLDLLILDPRGPGGWLRTVGRLFGGRRQSAGWEGGGDRPMEYRTFQRAEFAFDAPQPRELDGDPVTSGRRLTVEVRPGALTVLLPTRNA